MKSNIYIPFSVILVIVLLTSITFGFFLKEDRQQTSIKLSQITESPKSLTEENNMKTYTSSEAQFSFKYPSNLYVEKGREASFLEQDTDQKITYGSVTLCTVPISDGLKIFDQVFCDPKLVIVYGYPYLEDFDGGCDEANRQKVLIDGETVDSCMTEGSIGVLYPEHPKGISELSINSTFGEGLDKETVLEILNSIDFF